MAKALSVIQPHAELIRIGKKVIETRSWMTNYRGEIYIHASKTAIPKAVRQNAELLSLIGARTLKELERGFIVAKANLVRCEYMTPIFVKAIKQYDPTEYTAGYYSEGRYAWFLEDIEPLDKPIQMKGHLWVWNFDIENAKGEKENEN